MGKYRTFMGQSTRINKILSILASLHGTTQHLVFKSWDGAIGGKSQIPSPSCGGKGFRDEEYIEYC